MNKIKVFQSPLIKKEITVLRKKDSSPEVFRGALRRLTYLLISEISSELSLERVEIETPLEKTDGWILSKELVIFPILRAGLSMVDPFLDLIPETKVGHIGMERNEKTLKPREYYFKSPPGLKNSQVMILDPMLATGGSSDAAIEFLKAYGADDIIFISIIASPEGVEYLSEKHPDVKLFTASLDRKLNENGYILPGLGDAGDRTFGTL